MIWHYFLFIFVATYITSSNSAKAREKQANGITPRSRSHGNFTHARITTANANAKVHSNFPSSALSTTSTALNGAYATAASLSTEQPYNTMTNNEVRSSPSGTSCHNLTFEIIAPSTADIQPNFTQQYTVDSAKQCARLCYAQQCVTAGYAPPLHAGNGICLLSTEDANAVICDRWGATRVSDYGADKITQMQCVKCETKSSTRPTSRETSAISANEKPSSTTPIPKPTPTTAYLKGTSILNTTVGTSSVAENTSISADNGTNPSLVEASSTPELLSTAGPPGVYPLATIASNRPVGAHDTPASMQSCSATITFEVFQATPDQPDFTAAMDSNSALDCARSCYEKNCTLAGYSPALTELKEMRGFCFLAFGIAGSLKPCGHGTRVSKFEVVDPVTIACIRCSKSPENRTASFAAATPASLQIPEARTSEMPKNGERNRTKLVTDPWPVPEGPDYMLACCKQAGILPECMSACTEFIDLSVYERNPRCVDQFPKLLVCMNYGGNRSSCCRNRGIPDECLSYCNQRLVGDGEQRLDVDSCQKYSSATLTCAEEAHKLVPGTPTNLRVQVISAHEANVTWDAPLKKGEGQAPVYVVYYKMQSDSNYSKIRTPNTWLRLTNLENGVEYNVTVIAVNNYGFSFFTPVISKRIWSEENAGTTDAPEKTTTPILKITRARSYAPTSPTTDDFLPSTKVCNGSLTFEARLPDEEAEKKFSFTEQFPVKSAADCIAQCYIHRCLIAGYSPPTFGNRATCFFAYTGKSVCGLSPRIRELEENGNSVVEIHCIHCMLHVS